MQKKTRSTFRVYMVLLLAVCCLISMSACGQNAKPDDENRNEVDSNAATYSVTLNPNGGVFADGTTDAVTIYVKEGTAIDFPSYMPAYEGNTLYGWYQADGSPWPGARKVTQNISLKAKWSVAVEEVTYALVLVINDEPVYLEYDNGVYQFTHVSAIYGGYAQRSGKYTVYEEDLLAAANADDGSVQRVIYHAESNYIDATGLIYAEFYNDGEFELYYDYTNAGQRTKYKMDTGYWYYEGYTAPFEPTPLEEDTGMGAPSAHIGWDRSLLDEKYAQYSESGETEQPGETEESAAEFTVFEGEVVYTADAVNSETMKAKFSSNGSMAIHMTTYGVNVDEKYIWSKNDQHGFTITYNGGTDNIATDNGDGTYSFKDEYDNTYTVVLEDLLAAVGEPVRLYTATATNSKTMLVYFYDNGSFNIMFDLTSFGMKGQYSAIGNGQWRYGEEAGLEVAVNGLLLELTENGEMLEFTTSDNTYAVNVAELTAAMAG